MNDEISEEAKKSLADLARTKAIDRLERDGAHSHAALQRRVLALAKERNIPPADFHKLMYKRINTRDVMLFCEKHKVSYDWLLCGDLRGLQKMTQEARAERPDMPEALRKEVISLLCSLSPRNRDLAIGCIHQLAAMGHL